MVSQIQAARLIELFAIATVSEMSGVGRYLENWLESGIEVVLVVKVFAAIGFALSHLFDADEIIDDLAKVARRSDSPTVQDDLGQISVLLHRVDADRLAKLLSG